MAIASETMEAWRELLTGVSVLLRPAVEGEKGISVLADMFMRSSRLDDDLRRSLASALAHFPNRSQLLGEAYLRAKSDPAFCSSFKEQFRQDMDSESKRGSRTQSLEQKRQPRPDRLTLDSLLLRELSRRRDSFDSRSAQSNATDDLDTILRGEPLKARFNQDRTDPRCWDIALKFIAVCCKEQWRPGKTRNASIGDTIATNLPFMQRELAIEQIWE